MIKAKRDHIHDLFSQQGLRCTLQRRSLYQALAASTDHPTAEQLYNDVIGHTPGMSLATVYNTLEAFCQAGLAQKLWGKGGSVRYEANTHNHLHTRCDKSGAVHDVPEDIGQKVLKSISRSLLKQIEHEMGFKIDRIQIELCGQYTGP